ncbi:response regulator transcription factor [Leptolyngbya sp. FACHB-36]|nr:response regulator transcription factor [Leptolyngbya sp. FACHB-36]
MIRVLVGATTIVMRAGLEALIASSPTLEVVGSVNPRSLAQTLESLQPDVVLLEWDEPDEDLLALLSTTAIDTVAIDDFEGPSAPASVLLISDWQPSAIADVLRTGVRAVLPSDARVSEILAAIEAAAIGLTVLHPDVTEALLMELSTAPRLLPTAPELALTSREIEVLGMLAEGVGNKTIARRLGISEHTVKFHIGSIFSKLNASSRTEAVILGARQGLILI